MAESFGEVAYHSYFDTLFSHVFGSNSHTSWVDQDARVRQAWCDAAGAVIAEAERRQAANGYVLAHNDSLAVVDIDPIELDSFIGEERPPLAQLENTPHGMPNEPVVSFGDGLVRPGLQTQSPSCIHDKYDDPNYARRCICCIHAKVHTNNQFQVCADCFPRWAETHAKEIAAVTGVA